MTASQPSSDDLLSLEFRTNAEQRVSVGMAQSVQSKFVERHGLWLQYSQADGQAGLHGAITANDVDEWLAKGAPVDGLQKITSYTDDSEHWEPPLLTALVDGRLDVARRLIARGADPNALAMNIMQTIEGTFIFSLLTMMVSRRDQTGIGLLLEAGANANIRSSNGTTPIWFAAEQDDFTNAVTLLQAGAEKDVVDFLGRRPVDVAGPRTRDLLSTSAPIKKWDMNTPPITALFPERRHDLDFSLPIYTELPTNWQRPRDFTEVFLVAASLEFQERQRLNRNEPFAQDVWERLPTWCQYDAFESLLSFGGQTDAQTSRQVESRAEALTYLELRDRGERWGRFALLQLVWMYLDEVFPAITAADRHYFRILQRLGRVTLGEIGTALFLAALESKLQGGDGLTNAEKAFAAGHAFTARGLNGVDSEFKPDPYWYIRSIWMLCFRLIERNTPEHYLSLFPSRTREVRAIFSEVEQLVSRQHAMPYPQRHTNRWPGWEVVMEL